MKKNIWARLRDWLGLTSDIGGAIGTIGLIITGILFFVPKSCNESESPAKQAKENTYQNPPPAPMKDSVEYKVDSSRLKKSPFDSLESIAAQEPQKIAPEKDVIITKTVDYTPQDGDEDNTKNIPVIEMKEPPPADGMGKLALRVICGHCENGYGVEILDIDSNKIADGSKVFYDSMDKKRSTFVQNLEPGNYIVKIKFDYVGMNFLPITIKEQKISLVIFTKTNPFGNRNGKVILRSKDRAGYWFLYFQRKTYGTISFEKKDEYSFIVPAGNIYIKLVPVHETSMDEKQKEDYFYLRPGEQVIRKINDFSNLH